MRVRICVGMKRYFHGKNIEGLLSNAVSHQTFQRRNLDF